MDVRINRAPEEISCEVFHGALLFALCAKRWER